MAFAGSDIGPWVGEGREGRDLPPVDPRINEHGHGAHFEEPQKNAIEIYRHGDHDDGTIAWFEARSDKAGSDPVYPPPQLGEACPRAPMLAAIEDKAWSIRYPLSRPAQEADHVQIDASRHPLLSLPNW
jgi:hypothetical protein